MAAEASDAPRQQYVARRTVVAEESSVVDDLADGKSIGERSARRTRQTKERAARCRTIWPRLLIIVSSSVCSALSICVEMKIGCNSRSRFTRTKKNATRCRR